MDYISGRNAVLEHLKDDDGIEKIYFKKGDKKGSIRQIYSKAKDLGIPIIEVDGEKLDEMAPGENHQGVVALGSSFKYSTLDELLQSAKELNRPIRLLVLDEIEDPHNLGAIIRTAEAASFTGIIIPKRRSASVTQTVHRASAGATAHVRVAKVTNISQTIDRLKSENIWVYGTDDQSQTIYTEADLRGNVALVIGNEGKGIGQAVKKHCDQVLNIPMLGNVSSLNASNAAALMIYEVLRQNDFKVD